MILAAGVEVVGMKERFRDYEPDQGLILPPSLGDWLPKDHFVYFVLDVVEQLDLTAIYASYEERRGQPPYSPRMMVGVWLYAFARGIRSSRRVERALIEDLAFRVLSGNQQPDFWTLNQFRTRHIEALGDLFKQTIRMAQEAGLVKLGQVAFDGTKIEANASKHSAMSYDRMEAREQDLEAEIKRYFEEADKIDKEEDRKYGDRRGDELPEHLNTMEKRLKAIKQAKETLEQEARERARAEQDKRRQEAEDEGRPFNPRIDPDQAKPDPKAQRNFTDPDSRIMRDSDKAFVQAYNGQLGVDVDSQIIVAADLTNQAADSRHLPSLIEQVIENTGETPDEVSADAGYFSEENLAKLDGHNVEAFIPPDRVKHSDWKKQKPPIGRIPKDISPADRMRRKLRTSRGRQRYKHRQCSVEPVFGQMKEGRGLRQFLHRGLAKVRPMWLFDCAVHNLLKIFRSGYRFAAQ